MGTHLVIKHFERRVPKSEEDGGRVDHGVLRVHESVVGRVGLGGNLLWVKF